MWSPKTYSALAARVVVNLAEVVAHDLDVAVRHGPDELEIVDAGRAGCPWAGDGEQRGAGCVLLDAGQHPHAFGDLHRRPEQVDGMAAGLAQRGGTLHDGDLDAVPRQPVSQYGTGDAGA